jgi:isoleucyl-tRNA synthetase
MAVFQGSSWNDACSNLFVRVPQLPRSTALVGKNRDSVGDEIEEVRIHGAGRIELCRRSSPPFWITLSETTPQDLVAELGPPDAIYRKNDRRILIHGGQASRDINSSPSPLRGIDPTDVDHSSENSVTDDSDPDVSSRPGHTWSKQSSECFYNYFHHGFDILVSHPTTFGPPFPGSKSPETSSLPNPSQLTVTKLLLHGNIPGSYPFNRHRRSRWTIEIDPHSEPITSETAYSKISAHLKRVWKDSYSSASEEASLQRAMVLNRGWGDSPGSSVELLGGWEENTEHKQWSGTMDDGAQTLGNTELFGFPGLLFEVLNNGAVSCLTVY